MDIEKIIDRLNNGSNLDIESTSLGVSKRTLQRRIKENNYIYNRTECKYFKECENVKIEKPLNLQIDELENITVSRTYSIKENVYRALRAKGFFEETDMSFIVNKALESFIESKYFKDNY